MVDIPEHGAETTPGPPQGEARAERESAGSVAATLVGTPSTRDSRVLWLLNRMDPDGDGVPELRPLHLNRLLRAEFGISATTATADIAEANRRVQEAVNEQASTIGGTIKTALTRIAIKSETAAQFDVASSTWARLGKICGLEEKSDPSKAGTLSDEQLQAALTQAVDRRVEQMTDEEFAALVEKRKERDA